MEVVDLISHCRRQSSPGNDAASQIETVAKNIVHLPTILQRCALQDMVQVPVLLAQKTGHPWNGIKPCTNEAQSNAIFVSECSSFFLNDLT
jgi:hypothetical protein